MHLRTSIEQLGYSSHEAMVYLATLELGDGTETEIAKKAVLPRTTVDSVIESLHRKGLMSSYFKGRRKIWSAENPEKLMTKLREHEEVLKQILPELNSLRNNMMDAKLAIRTYFGVEEIKQIISDIIESKHHVSALMSWDDWAPFLNKSSLDLDDSIESLKRHFLRVRLLTIKTELSMGLKEKDSADLRITRFLPEDITIDSCTLIYNNKVAIISTDAKLPIGLLIEDKNIHHTMEVLFESLWQKSTDQFS